MNRTVYKHPEGWAEKENGTSRAGSVHRTQAGAEATAKGKIERAGGGELTTQGRNGKFRSKDTIGGGNDPFPPRDTEH